MADLKRLDLPSWITAPTVWDKPSLGSFQLPGVVHLHTVKKQLRFQKNKSSGTDGGSALLQGLEQPEFLFELQIYTKADEIAWNGLVPVILPTQDPTLRPAFYVKHPTLARLQIYACIVYAVEETPPVGGGPLIANIYCQSVIPAKPGATKKLSSKDAKKPNSVATIDIGNTKSVGAQLHKELNTDPPPAATPPSQDVGTVIFGPKAKNPNKR